MVDLATWRQGAYRLLGATFSYPDPPTVSEVSRGACELLSYADMAGDLAIVPSLEGFLLRWSHIGPDDIPTLQEDYTRLFGASGAHDPIPLAESTLLDPSGMNTGWIFTNIEAAYRSAGVYHPSRARESPDHLSVELEFMSFVCGSEAGAWANGNIPSARRSMNRAQRFMDKHLLRWLPAVARAIGRRNDGFYTCAVEAASDFLLHDSDLLALFRSRLREATEDHEI